MNRYILLISAASFLLLVPAVQGHVETSSSTTIVQQDNKISDENINAAVKNAIAADKELSKFVSNINITVDKGVVTVNGVVTSKEAKSNIESKVGSVMGVKKVVNNLVVKEVKEVK